MIYPNLQSAVDSLSRNLYTFAGHRIDALHQSYCFDQLARAIDYINRNFAVESVGFDGEIYVEGKVYPILVTFKGDGIDNPVDMYTQMA